MNTTAPLPLESMPKPLCVALIRQAGSWFFFLDQESHPAVSITPRRARPATTGWKCVRNHGTVHWAKRISIARTKSVLLIVALMTREGLFATRRKRTDNHPCSPKVFPSVVNEKQEQLNLTGRNKSQRSIGRCRSMGEEQRRSYHGDEVAIITL